MLLIGIFKYFIYIYINLKILLLKLIIIYNITQDNSLNNNTFIKNFKLEYILENNNEFKNNIRCTAHTLNLAAKAIINSFNKNTINSKELQEIKLSNIFTKNGEKWESISKSEKDLTLTKLLGIYIYIYYFNI